MTDIEIPGVPAQLGSFVALISSDDPDWGSPAVVATGVPLLMLSAVEPQTGRIGMVALDVESAHTLLHALNDWIGTQVEKHPGHG